MDWFEKATLGILISGIGIVFASTGIAIMKVAGVF